MCKKTGQETSFPWKYEKRYNSYNTIISQWMFAYCLPVIFTITLCGTC